MGNAVTLNLIYPTSLMEIHDAVELNAAVMTILPESNGELGILSESNVGLGTLLTSFNMMMGDYQLAMCSSAKLPELAFTVQLLYLVFVNIVSECTAARTRHVECSC